MQPIRPDAGKLVGSGCLLLFGVVFSSIAVLVLIAGLSFGAPWYFMLFDVPFLIAGFGMLGGGLWGLFRPMLVGTAFGPPSAALSASRVRLGETVSVRYEQAARRNLEIRRVQIQLVLREQATYRRGTNSYTVVQDNVMAEYESPGRPLASGAVLSESCSLRVPADSVHTFDAARNKLIWLVKVTVDVPKLPDVSEEVVFTVLPELAGEVG